MLFFALACRSGVSPHVEDTAVPVDTESAVETAEPAGPTAQDFVRFPDEGSWQLWSAEGGTTRVEKVAQSGAQHWLDVLGGDGVWQAGMVVSVDDDALVVHATQASGEAVVWHEPAERVVVDPESGEPCSTWYAEEDWSCVTAEIPDGVLAGTWWFAEGEGLAAWQPVDAEEVKPLQTRTEGERAWNQTGSASLDDAVVFEKVQSGVPTSQVVTLQNVGDEDLELWDATFTYNGGDLFSVSGFSETTLAPGESLELSVGVYFSGLAVSSAELRVLTSDGEQAAQRVDVQLVSSWM